MKKIIVLTFAMSVIALYTKAQSQSSSASQSVSLSLEPVIQISAMTSEDVNIGFNSVSDYASGRESAQQQFKVQSNKGFLITVQTDAEAFSYSGNITPAPTMPVANTLYLSVSDNQTGGSVGSSFSSYTPISRTPKDLILNCKNGGNQLFAVNYKATPGNNYPAGTYTVGVVYTASQP
ncbi:MAG: hypothetical protein H6551_04115 [Chitinophagales bacterium]|nr:hypothetical protein [Chitinophagaceae bacterium]MCB9064308.1 hypothetical protein [Chitinophagales bacterium]